jgi:glycosyltransferase involved in cell wall biosynthesis
MSALYICYQSVLEPLTQTQVVSYLEGLANAGYRMLLLTFEPRPLTADETQLWRDRLKAKGIAWHWLRYHKAPTVPATAWDILAGIIFSCWLVDKHQVKLLHARAHVPGVMAIALKYITGARFLFDVRGFMAEEYVDGGVWPTNGLLFRITKWVECHIVSAADGVVVLTDAARALLSQWYPKELCNKPIEVIPCCVDLRNQEVPNDHESKTPQTKKGPILAYAGKLGGWYPIAAIVDFLRILVELEPNSTMRIWTQSNPEEMRKLLVQHNLQDSVAFAHARPESLPALLASADIGLCFYSRNLSKACCSPTKVPEYLAAGLPVVCSSGIGDVDSLLTQSEKELGGPIGIGFLSCTAQAYRESMPRILRIVNDPETGGRCRAAAKNFDLESVGWPRYRAVYRALLTAGV